MTNSFLEDSKIVELRNVFKYFPLRRESLLTRKGKMVYAVNGVSFDIRTGETLGLVGESGCGKTTLGRMILGLFPPTSGEIFVRGRNIYSRQKEKRANSMGKVSVVFQDPFSSLDPRMNVYQIVAEPLVVQGALKGMKRQRRVMEVLDFVGISRDQMNRYPHEFSGGQRQRIAVARALVLNPELIVADEPCSALDVSIQAQIINLLEDLQEQLEVAYLLISHDLNVVYHISHRIAVMYLGTIVELGLAEELYDHPMHPYTQALIRAIPSSSFKEKADRSILKGGVQSPTELPKGCVFSMRCSLAFDECRQRTPELVDMGGEHYAACSRLTNLETAVSR